MANATPLCIPDTRIFPDTVLMGLELGNMSEKHGV